MTLNCPTEPLCRLVVETSLLAPAFVAVVDHV